MPEEPFVTVALPPGLYRNGTTYQTKGRWYDANFVRFYGGTIQPTGGFVELLDANGASYPYLVGCPRGAYAYRQNSGATNIVFGTTSHIYVIQDGSKYDITPTSFTAGACSGHLPSGTGNYGDGVYGDGVYGGNHPATYPIPGDTWSLDNFGNDLVATLTSDGQVLRWDGVPANPAVVAANAPVETHAICVTPERFLFSFGGIDVNGGSVADPRLIQWPSQESSTDWVPTVSNTAGSFPLTTAGFILAGHRTRRQTLIWTDIDLWTATYIGGTFIYQFDQVGDACGLIAPNAYAVIGDKAFWMSRRTFFSFDGFTRPMDCAVADAVFSDMSLVNSAQIHCQLTAEFNEVTWYYPSLASPGGVNNRYVTYNYHEDHWTLGSVDRESGVDRGISPVPIMVDSRGALWEHESGSDHGVDTSGRVAVPFLESGPFELGEGDQVMRVQRVIPDERTRGQLSLKVRTRMYPTDAATLSASVSLNNAAPVDVRFTARQVQLRFEEVATQAGVTPTSWRLGTFRFGVRPQGKR